MRGSSEVQRNHPVHVSFHLSTLPASVILHPSAIPSKKVLEVIIQLPSNQLCVFSFTPTRRMASCGALLLERKNFPRNQLRTSLQLPLVKIWSFPFITQPLTREDSVPLNPSGHFLGLRSIPNFIAATQGGLTTN